MTENEEHKNRRIEIEEGNYNERIEGNYVQGNRNFIFNFRRPDNSEALTSTKHSRIRQALLKQVNLEVESRINSSLHNRVYIVLDVEQNPDQIELPWSSEIKVGSQPKIRLDNTDIINVFDQEDVAGRLLILGQPGSGKTTMLLKLAEELVKRAKDNSTHPVPVLFSLSSWNNDNQNIKDWLVEKLKDKHGMRKDIGKQWIDNQEIIPLLDGLDELAAERQEKCVIKINEFLHPSNWTNPVVVCSRIQEYQRYTSLLQLNSTLELYPFSEEQVYQYLQSTDNLQLWDSISHDADLSQLANTPLLLNIIVLSAQEISIQTWQEFKSSEERLSYLFDAYIRRMLKRPYKDKQPNPKNTQRWLSWLAHRLIEESATEFLIEKMQPDWLKNKGQKIIYNVIVWGVILSLIYGLTGALIANNIRSISFSISFNLISDLISGLIYVLIFGLISGLIYVLIGNKIHPIENLNFSRKKYLKSLKDGLFLGVFFGLIFGLIFALAYGQEHLGFDMRKYDRSFRLISGLISGSIFGLIFGMIVGLFSGINGLEIENKNFPNQGIRQSVINTLKLSVMISLFASLIIFIVKIIIKHELNNQVFINSLGSGILFGVLIAICRSGTPAIKHFILRVILWSNGYVPWNYARFLNYCTNRLFLQRVGGGYRFIHDLLRQHFADSSAQKN